MTMNILMITLKKSTHAVGLNMLELTVLIYLLAILLSGRGRG